MMHQSRIMVARICGGCHEEASNPKRCSGCKNIWYCSTRCQTEHWCFHVFDCKTGKPVDTVYHLARACYRDVVPVDVQTRIDYGFDKASQVLGPEGEMMMCGLWRGIFVALDIDAKEVRKWRREGRLVERIKENFETVPERNRGAYYPWFLQHQWLLDGTPVDESRAHQNAVASADRMLRDGWIFAGGPPNDSPDDIRRKLAALPRERASCHALYFCLVSGAHPNPGQDLWLEFGFVAATCQGEELEFGRRYMHLIKLCTFGQFCTAFETSSIPALFEHCGLSMSRYPSFLDIMAGSPRSNKSVWDLKHYLDQRACSGSGDKLEPVVSAAMDYGFFNCKNELDRTLLDDLYGKLLSGSRANPLELHDACIKGQLLEYAKRFMKLAPYLTRYTRLLKNPYPLPVYDIPVRHHSKFCVDWPKLTLITPLVGPGNHNGDSVP